MAPVDTTVAEGEIESMLQRFFRIKRRLGDETSYFSMPERSRYSWIDIPAVSFTLCRLLLLIVDIDVEVEVNGISVFGTVGLALLTKRSHPADLPLPLL